jgi:DNA-binding response OmpR family regulator
MALIIVIDDSPLMRPALRDLLQLDGHTVLTTGRTDEALHVLDDIVGVDLVIADSVMLEMDGLLLARHLRADAKYKNVPLLMLFVGDGQYDNQRMLEAGADDFLVPPITVDHLKRTVKKMLNGTQAGL